MYRVALMACVWTRAWTVFGPSATPLYKTGATLVGEGVKAHDDVTFLERLMRKQKTDATGAQHILCDSLDPTENVTENNLTDIMAVCLAACL